MVSTASMPRVDGGKTSLPTTAGVEDGLEDGVGFQSLDMSPSVSASCRMFGFAGGHQRVAARRGRNTNDSAAPPRETYAAADYWRGAGDRERVAVRLCRRVHVITEAISAANLRSSAKERIWWCTGA